LKKIILAFLILLFVAGAVFAQATDSSYYVRTLPIVKVYSHQDGFKIVYRNSRLQYSSFYVPVEWFGGAAAKGELIYGDRESYPYFSIFWKDGQFDHIRLYLHRNRLDLSWGDLDPTLDIADKFEGVESIELDL
jgi:hypothetical protein